MAWLTGSENKACWCSSNYRFKSKDEDGALLGDYFADLLIENQLIIELKACETLVNQHTAQILGYLRCTDCEHGLLINFGSPKLQIKKFADLKTYPN